MKIIAVIGKPTITPHEANELDFLGMLIATAGHQLVTTNAPGTNAAVREGFERQGGLATIAPKNVFSGANQAIIYPDAKLLARLNESKVLNNVEHLIINSIPELEKLVRGAIKVVAQMATRT